MANLRREIIIDNRTTVINDIFAHMNKTEDISILSVGQNSAIMYSHRTATKPQKNQSGPKGNCTKSMSLFGFSSFPNFFWICPSCGFGIEWQGL